MDGIILIDKPVDFTSFDVVAVLRGVFHEKKLGHTGTLDPMATGVLPVMAGRATKLCGLLPDHDKRYTAGIRFGVTTDTLDITGQVTARRECCVTEQQLAAVLPRFTGEILQRPPMYSAVSVNGVRLYELARRGVEVERESRKITVYSAEITAHPAENEFVLDVSCSAGTYIRSLCADIGEALGTVAVLTSLRRTFACGFPVSRCHRLDEIRENPAGDYVIPAEQALEAFAPVTVTAAQARRFSNGGQLSLERLTMEPAAEGIRRVYAPDGTLIGLGEICPERELLNIKWLAARPVNNE